MSKEFSQLDWDAAVEEDCRQIVRLAIREEFGPEPDSLGDLTTDALISPDVAGKASLVVRSPGVVCGLRAAHLALAQIEPRATWISAVSDGHRVTAGAVVAQLAGPARSLLKAERLMLNFIGRLSGISTLTRRYVDAVAGSKARIFDTRKTTPGWRRLEKYAVRCGGGSNHRTGLFDAVLIKDNHLALGAAASGADHYSPAGAVERARQFLKKLQKDAIIEVEVDTLEQLEQVLKVSPDIILLDNMSPQHLRTASARRDALAPNVHLEASGGISLTTLAEVAGTGVDRISVGALTHSAVSLDVGLDWGDSPTG